MAGISKKTYKTKKKGVVTKYTISYTDIFGKQHTSGLHDTPRKAKQALKTFDKEKTDCSKITYGEIFKSFLEKVKKKNSDGTYKNYDGYYKAHFKKFDHIQYEKIDSLWWQNFFDDLQVIKGSHVAEHCLKMAKAAVNRFVNHDKLTKNVFAKIEKIELPKADINHFTVKELKTVLETCKRIFPQYYAILYTLIGTGAREGEIFALTKKDYLKEDLSIVINKQFTRNKLYPHPKTSHSNRTVAIFEDLAKVLDEHIKTLDPDNPLLFPNNAGNYLNASNFRERFWKKLLKILGVEKRVRLHDLRGSYIDATLSSGLSVKFTQNNVGHAKGEMTLNQYARLNQDMIDRAQTVLNDVFKKTENNLRINENTSNSKIIPFPKKQSGTGF